MWQKNLVKPLVISIIMLILLFGAAVVFAVNFKPNILVIWGDDIGVHNVSAYNHGVMGYQTPYIDRIADEGAMFVHILLVDAINNETFNKI